MSWNNGYVSDIEYPACFFYKQSPVHLNFTCLLNGYAPIPLDQPFTCCELGCGPGLTSNILAASNPQGRFYAVDFNPAHVAGGREMASRAGLDNLTMLENSFDELAAGKVDLPQFDFITMYGVYGWVNDENRKHIVAFLKRYVKPGGIVHLNYNTMPGWAAVLPLQRLMLEMVDAAVGTRQQRVEHTRQLIVKLDALQAKYLTENASPILENRLRSIRSSDAGYLSHEYLNHGWRPLYQSDVAEQLAEAGLAYTGSAELLRFSPDLYLTPEQKALFERTPVERREALIDYLRNTSFRNDVYVRGGTRLASEGQVEWMQRIGLALSRPRSLVNHKIELVTGEEVDRPDLYEPVLDALEASPCTLAELMRLPVLASEPAQTLYQMAALLINTDQVCAYHADAASSPDAARRMNRAIARHAHYDEATDVLASPVLGNGVSTSKPARLVYRILCEQGETVEKDDVLRQVQEWMEDGEPSSDSMEDRETLRLRVQNILEKLVPLWRQLKII